MKECKKTNTKKTEFVIKRYYNLAANACVRKNTEKEVEYVDKARGRGYERSIRALPRQRALPRFAVGAFVYAPRPQKIHGGKLGKNPVRACARRLFRAPLLRAKRGKDVRDFPPFERLRVQALFAAEKTRFGDAYRLGCRERDDCVPRRLDFEMDFLKR